MSRKWLVPGVIAGVVLVLVLLVVGGYNGLVNQREGVNNKFATLQSQYQRRADLVPNLVNTVKGAANFEKDTLTQVTEARAKATSIQIDPSKATPAQLQQYEQSQGQLSQALGKLLAVAEAYPTLTATQNFRDLQTQLEGTENRIAVARKDYNDAVTPYNAHIQRFPAVLTAKLFGFDKYPYFQADQNAQSSPTVNFGQ